MKSLLNTILTSLDVTILSNGPLVPQSLSDVLETLSKIYKKNK